MSRTRVSIEMVLPTIARKCICNPPANNRFSSIPIYPFFKKKKKKIIIKLAFSNQNTRSEIVLFSFRNEESMLYTNENRDLISRLSIIINDEMDELIVGQVVKNILSRTFMSRI